MDVIKLKTKTGKRQLKYPEVEKKLCSCAFNIFVPYFPATLNGTISQIRNTIEENVKLFRSKCRPQMSYENLKYGFSVREK